MATSPSCLQANGRQPMTEPYRPWRTSSRNAKNLVQIVISQCYASTAPHLTTTSLHQQSSWTPGHAKPTSLPYPLSVHGEVNTKLQARQRSAQITIQHVFWSSFLPNTLMTQCEYLTYVGTWFVKCRMQAQCLYMVTNCGNRSCLWSEWAGHHNWSQKTDY